jgi:catechol 2,3-dioxygenase-like lactoylglutathione lyase family enzyme
LELIGIELVVADLERSLELFCGILGFELLQRGPSEHVAGEFATVDTGTIVLTLLAPASSGEGALLAERTPRLAQVIVGAGGVEATAGALDRTIRAGLSAVPSSEGRFHITPEAIDGALGLAVAVVVTTVDPS